LRQAPIREQVLTPLAECELQQHVEDLLWRCAFRRPGWTWERLGSGEDGTSTFQWQDRHTRIDWGWMEGGECCET